MHTHTEVHIIIHVHCKYLLQYIVHVIALKENVRIVSW